MTSRIVWLGAVSLLAIGLLASSAHAGSVLPKAPNLDFSSQTSGPGGQQHSGGYVGFSPGAGNILSVTGAPIYQLLEPSGHHTAGCPSGRCGIEDGKLNIFTGGCMMGCAGSNHGSETAFFSGQGSSLTITGEIPGLGINSDATLLKGYFVNLTNSSAPALSATLNSSGAKNTNVQSTGGIDGYLVITLINPAIIDLLGLNGTIGKGYLSEMYFGLDLLQYQNSWDGTLAGSSVLVVPTPETATLFLLATVLLTAAWLSRRTLRA